MAKLVHSDPSTRVGLINNQGREYQANADGEFDVENAQVEPMKKRFGLVEKDESADE